MSYGIMPTSNVYVCKPNCDIIFYNKTMIYDLGYISLYEGICVYMQVWLCSGGRICPEGGIIGMSA